MSEHMRYEDASDRVITIANAMTAARPFLAAGAVVALYKGNNKLAAGLATLAAVSDKEGTVGRAIEKKWPGWGITKWGVKSDPLADSAALAITGIGVLFHKKVHPVAKAGVGAVMAQEVHKIKWAAETTKDYRERTGESGIPVVPVTETGKRATFSKLVTAVGAVATAVLKEDSKWCEPIAYATLGTGVIGTVLGEQALGQLKVEYAGMAAGFESTLEPTVLTAE